MEKKLNKEYKDKIISLIRAMMPNAKIILFGSRAVGNNSEFSDVDIAIDAGEKQTRVTIGEIREVLNATNIPVKIDVVDYHSVSKSMQEDIRNEGIVWKN